MYSSGEGASEMWYLRKVAAVAVLLTWMTTPGMACVLPGGQLTQEQDECCLSMNGECDEMPFPDSCCQTTVQPDHVSLAAQSFSFAPNMLAAALLPEDAPGPVSSRGFHDWELRVHSPPDSPSEFHIILRI